MTGVEMFEIKEKADLLLYIRSLAERVHRCSDIDKEWNLEIDKIKKQIRETHGPEWVRVLVCKMLMADSFRNCIHNQDILEVKNIITKIQNR